MSFPITFGNFQPRFQGHGVTIDAIDVLCVQFTRDLFAIAKFLVFLVNNSRILFLQWARKTTVVMAT